MTKCKVKSKAFTGIRAPARWNQSMGPIAENPISLSFSHFLDEFFFSFFTLYIYMKILTVEVGKKKLSNCALLGASLRVLNP